MKNPNEIFSKYNSRERRRPSEGRPAHRHHPGQTETHTSSPRTGRDTYVIVKGRQRYIELDRLGTRAGRDT